MRKLLFTVVLLSGAAFGEGIDGLGRISVGGGFRWVPNWYFSEHAAAVGTPVIPGLTGGPQLNASFGYGVAPVLEVLADKIVALPTSISRVENGTQVATPTRIRHRDIWDIAWLVQQGATLDANMVNAKIDDYGIEHFEKLVDVAVAAIPDIAAGSAFKAQMRRFIKNSAFDNAFGKSGYDAYLAATVIRLLNEVRPTLASAPQ